MHKSGSRSPVADYLERYSRTHRGALLNPDGTVNTGEWSRLTGISQPGLYRIMSGETRNPTHDTVKQIAAYTGDSPATVWGHVWGQESEVREFGGRPASDDATAFARRLDDLPPIVRESLMRHVDALLAAFEQPPPKRGIQRAAEAEIGAMRSPQPQHVVVRERLVSGELVETAGRRQRKSGKKR